ncbi:AAA family ATPase [Dactylosporangium sp. NPDC049525]|uniref:helix-turn-helix transcriptional regulator n=1 Tax=Dactylosporangium sp. NPDC049525 TaxID=3154730 RepID=UPI00344A2475
MGAHLVGRRHQFEELARVVAGAAAQQGALVVLCGEAGIGKTTMLSWLAGAASDAGMVALSGRAVAEEGVPAFWPWSRVFAAGRALGLSPDLLELGPGPPAQARFVAIERAAGALLAAVPAAGLLITLDDLQWADDATMQLLRHAAAELPGTRLILAVATRDAGGLGPRAAVLPAARTLRLAPWTPADVAEYLHATGGRVDPSWPARVHRGSGGNPLFVREMARVLHAGGGGLPDALHPLAGVFLDSVGPDCRSLLGACAVIGEEFDVTLVAAASGEASHPAAVRSPGGLAELLAEAVSAGILAEDAAVPNRMMFTHALVRQAAYDELPRTDRIRWHRRIADALAGMPATPSSAGRAADIARHRVRAATDAPSCRAAVDACRAAVAVSLRGLDHADAAHWFRRAIELAGGAGLDPAEHADLLLGLAETEFLDLRVAGALRHCVAGADLAAGLGRPDLLARAALVVRGIGGEEPNRIIADLCVRAETALGGTDSGTLAQVLAQHAMAVAQLAVTAPDLARQAHTLSAQAMAMARHDGGSTAVVDAMHAHETLAGGPDSMRERTVMGAGLRALAAVPDRPETPLWACLWRIDGCLGLGAVAEADREIAALASLAERLGWPVARWHLLRARAARAMLAGRFPDAQRLADEGQALAERCGDHSMQGQHLAYTLDIRRKTGSFADPWSDAGGSGDGPGGGPFDIASVVDADARPIVLAIAAEYLFASGDVDTARALYARLVTALPDLPEDIRWPAIVAIAGELGAAFADPATVAAGYRGLLPYAQLYQASTYGYRGAFARVLGGLAAASGDHGTAIGHLQAAEELERRIGAHADLALAQLAHARVRRARDARGDRERAADLAGQAARTARRLGMTPTLTDATSLLRDLGGVADDVVASLTAREREVALLVADGLANRAIADRLTVSERTVETHVRNLLNKLGLANRTQVAAWILRAESAWFH